MLRFLRTSALILAIILFPPAFLAFVSQNAIPGDSLYPVKRQLEDVVLIFASVSHPTRTWFAVAYSQRRYQETVGLLAKGDKGAVPKTLDELVVQTGEAANEIKVLNNDSFKRALADKLSTSITEYNTGLENAKNNLSPSPQASPQPSPQPSPAPAEEQISDEDLELQRELSKAQEELVDIQEDLKKLYNGVEEPEAEIVSLESVYSGLNGIDDEGLSTVLNSTTDQYGKLLP